MAYSDKVIDHYENPRNVGSFGKNEEGVATGMVEREAAAFKRWYDMGMRFLVCNSDGNMLRQASANDVKVIAAFAS